MTEETDEKVDLIPGKWIPYTKPDMMNRMYRTTQTNKVVKPEEGRKIAMSVFFIFLVGLISFLAMSVLGFHLYTPIIIVTVVVLGIGMTAIARK